MKTILIDDEIGYDWWTDSGVTAKSVQEQLNDIPDGEDIEIEINSPGGSVYEGAVIFNLIREIAKTHSVSVRLNCMALSMASYIALAARTVDANARVTAMDNSVLMIHNPWTISQGDYQQLRKDADYLEKLADMYAKVHSYVSGQGNDQIRQAMDNETWYVGREIVDAGFANNFEEITPKKGEDVADDAVAFAAARKTAIENARAKFREMNSKTLAALAEHKQRPTDDAQRAAALADKLFIAKSVDRSAPAASSGGGTDHSTRIEQSKGGCMKPEELQAQDKACYDEVLALGEKGAVEKERARVAALLKRGEKCNAMDIAMKHIQDGKAASDDDVVDEFLNAATDKKREQARLDDNIGPISGQGDIGGGGDKNESVDAFVKGLRGEKL
jgi:ATP-dependent protease ClpP protease subunit